MLFYITKDIILNTKIKFKLKMYFFLLDDLKINLVKLELFVIN